MLDCTEKHCWIAGGKHQNQQQTPIDSKFTTATPIKTAIEKISKTIKRQLNSWQSMVGNIKHKNVQIQIDQ